MGLNPVGYSDFFPLCPMLKTTCHLYHLFTKQQIYRVSVVNSALFGNVIANNSLTDNINYLLFLFYRGCTETGQWRMCYMSGRLVYRYEAFPGPDCKSI